MVKRGKSRSLVSKEIRVAQQHPAQLLHSVYTALKFTSNSSLVFYGRAAADEILARATAARLFAHHSLPARDTAAHHGDMRRPVAATSGERLNASCTTRALSASGCSWPCVVCSASLQSRIRRTASLRLPCVASRLACCMRSTLSDGCHGQWASETSRKRTACRPHSPAMSECGGRHLHVI